MQRLTKIAISIIACLMTINSGFAGEGKLVKTKEGALQKVIVARDTATFDEPNRESGSQPVRQFQFFLVSQPGKQESGGSEFYPVTETEDATEVRWLPADDVVEWAHRQAFLLTSREHREPVQVFKTVDDAASYLNKLPDVKAIAREPSGVDVLSFFPVIEEHTTDVGQEKRSIFRTCCLVGPATGAKGKPKAGVTKQKLSQQITLDICFVIDGTGSMEPWIAATKETVIEIEKRVRKQVQLKDRIRFSLVVYRDVDDGEPVQILCNFATGSKPGEFVRALDSVIADGGGDEPEQMFEGVYDACTRLDFNPIANRHLIVIGDSASHEGEKALRSIDAVLSAAQPSASRTDFEGQLKKITIHSLMVSDATDENAQLCTKQLQTLSQGLDNQGLYSGTANRTEFVEQVVKLISDRMADVGDVIRGDFEMVSHRAAGKSESYAGPLAEIAFEVASGEVTDASFSEGFIAATDSGGNATVSPHVLISRRDLTRFNATLEFFVTLLKAESDPGTRKISNIIEGLQRALLAAELDQDLPVIDNKTRLSEVLSLSLGLPIRNPLFDVDAERLESMTQADFETLVMNLADSQQSIKAHLDAGRFFNLGDETRADQQFTFVRIDDLP